ncbi:MAG: ABC transporter ATP-binding protein [Candidatus Rokubacteria bacterium]|nr:ABC transporter ATP-binding protein [Candidatus Rokubacteria bacterium]
MTEALLEIRGLTVSYGSRLATWAVDLTLRPGEVLGLVGESGAGKSTVGRAIVRLLPESGRVEAGTIRFKDRDLLSLPEAAIRDLRGAEIALIPQDPLSALNPTFRVGLQATDALRFHRGLSRPAAEAEIARLLGRMGIPDPGGLLQRYPHELSGGMRQRVLLAMAFSCEPSLVIADEPTTALDVTTQAQILRILDGLRAERGVATLFVTHDLGVVAHVAHTVAIMYAGCLVELAPTPALFAAPGHPYTQALLAQTPRADRRAEAPATLEGLMPMLGGPPRACPFRDRCPKRMGICDELMPPLDPVGPDHLVACHLYGESP